MSRFLTTLGALGLSLAATTAFAHGGFHGSFDGPRPVVVTPFTSGNGLGSGKVRILTAPGKIEVVPARDLSRDWLEDRRDDDRDRRELTEERRIEEIKKLTMRKEELQKPSGWSTVKNVQPLNLMGQAQ